MGGAPGAGTGLVALAGGNVAVVRVLRLLCRRARSQRPARSEQRHLHAQPAGRRHIWSPRQSRDYRGAADRRRQVRQPGNAAASDDSG